MQVRKILLIEDEQDIRTIGELSLAEVGGWEVLLAANGKEGIALALSEQPDLIILDVMMPEMDGPTTLSQLRARPETTDIPVIFMTAKVQKTDVERLGGLDVSGIIPKPFDPLTLPDEIRRIVAG